MYKRKVVYLAGALRGNILKQAVYFALARRTAKELWKNNIVVYSPHMNSGWIDHPKTDEILMSGNIEMLLRCDILFILPNWRKSEGTRAEISKALEKKMPIYFNLRHLISDMYHGAVEQWQEVMYKEEIDFNKFRKLMEKNYDSV